MVKILVTGYLYREIGANFNLSRISVYMCDMEDLKSRVESTCTYIYHEHYPCCAFHWNHAKSLRLYAPVFISAYKPDCVLLVGYS